jgi:hypothetical protein
MLLGKEWLKLEASEVLDIYILMKYSTSFLITLAKVQCKNFLKDDLKHSPIKTIKLIKYPKHKR